MFLLINPYVITIHKEDSNTHWQNAWTYPLKKILINQSTLIALLYSSICCCNYLRLYFFAFLPANKVAPPLLRRSPLGSFSDFLELDRVNEFAEWESRGAKNLPITGSGFGVSLLSWAWLPRRRALTCRVCSLWLIHVDGGSDITVCGVKRESFNVQWDGGRRRASEISASFKDQSDALKILDEGRMQRCFIDLQGHCLPLYAYRFFCLSCPSAVGQG